MIIATTTILTLVPAQHAIKDSCFNKEPVIELLQQQLVKLGKHLHHHNPHNLLNLHKAVKEAKVDITKQQPQ